MNAMIPGCFVLRDEWAGKLNFMQLAPPKKETCLFSLKLESVIFSMGFGWDKDWNFTVSVGKTWHLRQVYGDCLPGFLFSSVKLIFEESAHMFLSGSAETVMPLLLRFRTRTNSALPLQRDDVFAPVKKNCLGDMSPFWRGGMLHLQTNYSLEQPCWIERQNQNHRRLRITSWIGYICMQNCIVVYMDHDNSGTTDVVRCHFDAFSTQRPLIALERPPNGSLLCMAKICGGVWSLLNIPKLILKTTVSPIIIGNWPCKGNKFLVNPFPTSMSMGGRVSKNCSTSGWFQIFLSRTPIWGPMIQFDAYFSNGLVQPLETTN